VAWFACATRRPIGANTGGIIGDNRGLLLHHAVMNGSGWALFNNPATRASAHFWVFKDGRIEQYIDSAVVAWHSGNGNGNAWYCGVETEGCAAPPHAEPMTEPMVAALARLYAEGARVHGWPNALIGSVGPRGFGFHRMASSTACPCDVRLNRRPEILNRAFGGGGQPAPPDQGDDDLTPAQNKMLEEVWTRLLQGTPDLKPAGFGSLQTLDQAHRDLWNKIVGIETKIDALAKK
jgi:hypothetical protein